MNNQSNRAGKSTREGAERRRKSGIGTAIFGLVALFVLGCFMQNQKELGIGPEAAVGVFILALLVKVVIESKVNRTYKTEMKYVRGAKAEETIGDLLEQLPSDYLVLHDVNFPYGNIDHVVISTKGVFLIETKSHHGTVVTNSNGLLINGNLPEKDFIKQALSGTFWLRDEIKDAIGEAPWITPVIVFTNAFVKANAPVKGVTVVNKGFLLTLLQRNGRPNAVNAKVWVAREGVRRRLVG